MADPALAPLAELFPAASDVSRDYWEGLAAGELRLQRCVQCSAYQHPPESFCRFCPSTELAAEAVPGRGSVYSFVVVHQRYHAAFADRLPYNVAVIELDEGPRMLAGVLGVDNDALEIGMRVRPRIEPIADGQAALFFEPDED